MAEHYFDGRLPSLLPLFLARAVAHEVLDGGR